MRIAVASGKGGTGKTTVALALSMSVKGSRLLDCDVEEPNAGLFLEKEMNEVKQVFLKVPRVDPGKCRYCGACAKNCSFGAITVIPPKGTAKGKFILFEHLCKSCLACVKMCPENALGTSLRHIGNIESGTSDELFFTEGRLKENEIAAPLLIRETLKEIKKDELSVVDAPPGASCSMVAAVRGCDYCILVTEPTVFGLNDLAIAAEAVISLGVPCGIVINKSTGNIKSITDFCGKNKIPLLMEIPFNMDVAKAYSDGMPLVNASSEYAEKFRKMHEKIVKNVMENRI